MNTAETSLPTEESPPLSPETPGTAAEAPCALPTGTKPLPANRVTAIDAFRGFVMLLMMAEVLHLVQVAKAFPGSWIWEQIAFNADHVEWIGCSLHDLIQPSFSFLVGAALPFSIASRRAKGQGPALMTAHAVWRALILIALGIFLRSVHGPRTHFTFEDTLTQIGLGYSFLFVLGFAGPRTHWAAFSVIVFGYWLAYALYPLPGPDFDYHAVGVPKGWWPHFLTGFAAHWNKGSNAGAVFDHWFLNLPIFHPEKPFVETLANRGGYLTLSFIPTLGTMILGLIAGTWLKSSRTTGQKLGLLAAAGFILMLLGLNLDLWGFCPIVKRIWTPSWTLFSGGACCLLLFGFYLLTDAPRWRTWALPLLVIGTNSIAAYCIAHLCHDFISSSLDIHLGKDFFAYASAKLFTQAGAAYAPLLQGAAVLLIYWLILLWMYRRRIFLRI
jgi:predicted acyltransferase